MVFTLLPLLASWWWLIKTWYLLDNVCVCVIVSNPSHFGLFTEYYSLSHGDVLYMCGHPQCTLSYAVFGPLVLTLFQRLYTLYQGITSLSFWLLHIYW